MTGDTWRIWDRDHSVEQRAYRRATGELPEMECTKQLVELVASIYSPGMTVLDVGCAAGHYYNGLRRVDSSIRYCGVDATSAYIEFARRHFNSSPHATFEIGDIFELPREYGQAFDIVFCCNVLLHLPSIQVPLRNLIRASKRYCIIRTLLSKKTHLSRLLYSDAFDDNGNPTDFVYQNTYSYDLVRKTIAEIGDYKVEFIDDRFDPGAINAEYLSHSDIQSAVTRVQGDLQIAGSKVFEWKWILVTK
jgi:2-polyprenyl-3-methyl-5-hydroxy-6-metoxy-1,4-benzoquinol methylase